MGSLGIDANDRSEGDDGHIQCDRPQFVVVRNATEAYRTSGYCLIYMALWPFKKKKKKDVDVRGSNSRQKETAIQPPRWEVDSSDQNPTLPLSERRSKDFTSNWLYRSVLKRITLPSLLKSHEGLY